MLEIYNEHVRDLLNKKKSPQSGLNVKEKPKVGFYGEKAWSIYFIVGRPRMCFKTATDNLI